MKVYRGTWFVVCAALASIGTIVAFLLSVTVLATLVVTFGFVGAVLAAALVEQEERTSALRLRRLAAGALTGGVGAGSFMGYTVLLGAGALLLGVAVLASSPPVLGRYLRWLAATPVHRTTTVDRVLRALAYSVPDLAAATADDPAPAEASTTLAPEAPVAGAPAPEPPAVRPPWPGVRGLTDEDLCRRWRASFRTVREAPGPRAALWITEERQLYLDELERRNVEGFRAWLASSPRAAGDPLPHLDGRRPGGRTIRWDELTDRPHHEP